MNNVLAAWLHILLLLLVNAFEEYQYYLSDNLSPHSRECCRMVSPSLEDSIHISEY